MPRSRAAASSLFCGLLLAAVVPAASQELDPAPPIEWLRLAGPVYMLRSNTPIGNPTTVASIGPDGVFVSDPNLEVVGEELIAALAELGGERVRFVTSSHSHGDHTEGFATFASQATILATLEQRRALAGRGPKGDGVPLPHEALPVLTFEGSLTLHFNGEEIQVTRPPNKHGHTDGDLFIYFKGSGVLYLGDYLFLDRFPIVDVESGGDLEGFLENLSYVLETYPASTVVVPGHGRFEPQPLETATMEQLADYLALLNDSIAIIRGRMAAGVHFETLVEEGLPERFSPLGERPRYVKPEAWIRMVWDYYESGG